MLQRQEQRKVEKGKETSFRYKGVEVSKAKLERYKKARAAADTSCSTMCNYDLCVNLIFTLLRPTSHSFGFVLLDSGQRFTCRGYVSPQF